MPMLMGRCFPVKVGVLFRARLGVSGAQMKRSVGIAACKRERQQHDQAAQEQGSLHCTGTNAKGFENVYTPA